MRNTVGGLLGLVGVAGCNDSFPKGEYGPCKTILGLGPAYNQPTDFKGIIDNANVNAVTNVTNVAGLDSEGITDIVGGFDVLTQHPRNQDSRVILVDVILEHLGMWTTTGLYLRWWWRWCAAAPIYGF